MYNSHYAGQWLSCLSAPVLGCTTLIVASFPAYAQSTHVTANYRIAYAGVNIGTFHFKSKIKGRKYELVSSSRVKVLFGVFKWKSKSRSVGSFRRQATPSAFDFDYKIKKKRKRTKMRFSGGNVSSLNNQPPVRPSKNRAPITPAHLRAVVDPMTAILRMTDIRRGKPCEKTINVFDGRLRFRLVLTPKGRLRIKDQGRGLPNVAHRCAVRFTPIAGYKKGRDMDQIARNKGIEIILRPVPSAKIAVPYQISVPTSFGTVAITAKRIDILSPNNQQITLKR